MATIGTATAAPGERSIGRLKIGEQRDGSPATLPVAVINGAASGDTIYIQAASDGDELNGVGVLRRLTADIDPNNLAGKLLCVGIVNFHGFQVGEHRNPIDKKKINRTYPGDEFGSSSERIAAATFNVAKRADIVVDLHQATTDRMVVETRVRCGSHHRLHEECLNLAKTFDTGYILDEQGARGQLARVACQKGIPAINPELGGSVGWDQESISKGVRGMYNLLKRNNFLSGSTCTRKQYRVRSLDHYVAPTGGFITYKRELGEHVDAGDTMFEVTDTFGQSIDRITANNDGIFWRTRRLPQVASGEYVCSIGTSLDQY